MTDNETKRSHYERIIVACAFLLLFVNVGFTSTAFSIYQSYIVDLPGVGNVGGSTIVTIRTCIAFICMFFTGWYYKHLNPRIGFFVATFSSVLAFVAFGFADGMLMLSIGAVLAGIGYGFGGMVASTYLIGNWFHGKVGSVSGVMSMGSGVASILMPLIAGALIEYISLSTAFFVEAGLALLCALFVLAFVRMTPYEIGLRPIEAEKEKGKKKARKEEKEAGSTLTKQIGKGADDSPLKTPVKQADADEDPSDLRKHPKVKLSEVPLPKVTRFAMMFALVLLGGVSVAGYNYFGILLTTQGIDASIAAALISVAGIFLTLSKFAVGIVCDRFGTLMGSALFFLLLIGGMLLCALIGTGGVPEAAFAAMILGIGMPLGTTGISLWSLELSSQDSMLKNIRHFQLSYAFGGFIFNMMPGTLAQITGTYTASYWILAAMSVVCAIIILTIYSHHILRARRAWKELHQGGRG